MLKSFLFIGCLVAAQSSQECKEVTTVENFNITDYASAKWYIHQQAETVYLPKDRNYCVSAEYEILDDETILGWTVQVYNKDQDENGNKSEGSNSCAYIKDPETPSKLAVGPCFLPKITAGPYWVVAYNETEGYALISGGQPTEVGQNGGCTTATGSGVNESGLWIFSRSQERDDALIDKVRTIAVDAGFDISVLNDVDQSNCDESEVIVHNGVPSYLRGMIPPSN